MKQAGKQVARKLVNGQLACLREEFRKLPEDELFRMYLHYMVENRPEIFNRIVDTAIAGCRRVR